MVYAQRVATGRFWPRARGAAIASCAAALGLSWALGASANSGGRTGATGKNGRTCTSCHQGGAAIPTVALDGPAALDAGALGTYTLRIETDARSTGMGAAASAADAVLSGDADGGTQADQGEITHIKPVPTPDDGGATVYTFTMQAPPFGGRVTLFAAGNACNGDGQTTGDEAAATTLVVDVTGPPRPPEPEAGAIPRSDAGGPVDAGPADASDVTAGGDFGGGGCNATPTSAPGGALVLAIAAVAALLSRARRRRA
jgi:MYXO-CTERM domain-containing protein